MTHATPIRGRLPLAALPALMLSLAACGHDVTATGPWDYLQPLEDASDVAWPDGTPCAETVNSLKGGANGYSYAHARSCIQVPLAQVWAALQNPRGLQIGFYPERNQSTCNGALDVDPSYPLSFRTQEIPRGLGSQFDFDVTFAGGPTKRDGNGVPTEYVLGYHLTRWNSSCGVDVLDGSILFREIQPGVTGVEQIRHLNAKCKDDDWGAQAERWVRDFHAGLLSEVHGTPVPVTCSLP